MAIRIPIITDFNGKGVKRAVAEFKQLDGALAKTKFAFQKALLPATAAVAGLATVAVSSMNAAIQDQKAQMELARVMRATINATDDQIAATEEWIATQGKTLGITDDELRPAYAKLTRSIKDTTKVQKLLGLGFDISRGLGISLTDTVDALAKAYNGNMKSLRKLAPELSGLIKDGATADEVFAKLGETFGGAASDYALTAAGRMEILKLRFSELFEQLGTAFLPAFERLMPYFEDLATWLEKNPDKIAALATGMGRFAEAMVLVVQKVGDMLGGLRNGFYSFLNWLINSLNTFLNAVDVLLGPFINIGAIPNVNFGGGGGGGMGAVGRQASAFAAANPGYSAPGSSPLAQRAQNMANVTVNVNGGDPKAVVDAIVRWSRQNGRLPPQIQTAG